MKHGTDELTLVTGASGLVGNNLVRHLLSVGRPVRALIQQSTNSLQGLDIETVQGDILDPASLERAMNSVRFVYHLAAAVLFQGNYEPEQIRQINVEGTRNVVEACLRNGVQRLVHCSSIHACSHLPMNEAINETRVLAIGPGHMVYDQSKARAERAVMAGVQAGLDAVTILPTWIFGPNDFRPSASGEFMLQLIQRRLPAIVDGGYYCVDVRDVAQAAWAAEREGRCGERYILPGHYATLRQLADWACESAGVKPPPQLPAWVATVSAPAVQLACRVLNRRPLMTMDSVKIIRRHQLIETDKAEREIGFRSRPLQETIADTIGWLQNGFLDGRYTD